MIALGEQLAYRVAYKLVNGTIERGVPIEQTCRNRLCCNPGHLKSLVDTLVAVGRFGRTRIKRLTDEQIAEVHRRAREVRHLRLTRKTIMAAGFVKELAQQFDVSNKSIIACALGTGTYRESFSGGRV